ncbi:MAG: TetR/AcrR family transcriptional regulator [Terracidiphilus sp.]|jgi:AcrR family transcriptional regulator
MHNTDPSSPVRSATENRILAAAASLFSELGYNGVSTRDIASAAGVNEVTIYRHFPRKRDLYISVLSAELGRISLRGDLLAKVAHAADAQTALTNTFELISATVLRDRAFMRLILFSSLELKSELDEMLRVHLGELVEVVARYLQPWIDRGELHCGNAKGLIFALIAIVGFHQPLYRAFAADGDGLDTTFEAIAEMCLGIRSTAWDRPKAAEA